MGDGIRSGNAFVVTPLYTIRIKNGVTWEQIPQLLNKFGGFAVLPVHFGKGYCTVQVDGTKTGATSDEYRRLAFYATHDLVQAYWLRKKFHAGHEVKSLAQAGLYPIGRIATHAILRGTYVEFLSRFVDGAVELEPMHWVD